MQNRLTAALVAVVATPLVAAAEEVSFSADRPGFADGTSVVPAFRLQTEAGVTGQFADGANAFSAPELLLRLGLTEWLEARLSAPTFNRVAPEHGKAVSGLGDFGLGVKVAHAFSDALTSSIVAGVSLPTGADAFTSDGVDPEVALNVAYDLNDRFSVGANAKYA